jgi:hypothetical protein
VSYCTGLEYYEINEVNTGDGDSSGILNAEIPWLKRSYTSLEGKRSSVTYSSQIFDDEDASIVLFS